MAHEALNRHDEPVEISSNRSFGLVFCAVFAIVGLWPLMSSGGLRWWALGVSGIFAVLALLAPAVLAAPNRAWAQLGILLGKVVSPIMLGVLYYLVFTPMGLFMRLLGKDPLRTRYEPAAQSYWIRREPPGPEPSSLNNQF